MILDSLFFRSRKYRKISLKGKSKRSIILKSIIKSVTWRIIGSLDTMLISYFLTGDFTIAFSISGVEFVSKMILYYLHERVWAKITK